MNLTTEYLWAEKTAAQWSLQRTVQVEAQAGRQQMRAVGNQVELLRDSLLDVAHRRMEQASDFHAELSHQYSEMSNRFSQATEDLSAGFESVVSAIEYAATAIGSNLTEIRWAIDHQTDALVSTLSSPRAIEARELVTSQGIPCYNAGDYEDARKCFLEALEIDRTSYIACQYLGMIAVVNDDEDDAERRFSRAVRYATSPAAEAIARTHLVHLYLARGDLDTALEQSEFAHRLVPCSARFSFEYARTLAVVGRTDEMQIALREAILLNETYWTAPLLDGAFATHESVVRVLLTEMKENRRKEALEALEKARVACTMRISELNWRKCIEVVERFDQVTAKFFSANYFEYPVIQASANSLAAEMTSFGSASAHVGTTRQTSPKR